MDATASLMFNDPNNQRHIAANLFIDMLPSGGRAAIVRFGQKSEVIARLSDNKRWLKQATKIILNDLGTNTDVSDGLAAAYCELASRTENAEYAGVVVLFTDGVPDPSEGAVETEMSSISAMVAEYVASGWQISLVVMCGAGGNSLCDSSFYEKEIAEPTGGMVYTASTSDELISSFIALLANTNDLYISWQKSISDSFGFLVPPGMAQLISVGIGQIDLRRQGDEQFQSADCMEAEQFLICRIVDPQIGFWKAFIDPLGESEVKVLLSELDFRSILSIEQLSLYTVGGHPVEMVLEIFDAEGTPINGEIVDHFESFISVVVSELESNEEKRVVLVREGHQFKGSFNCPKASDYKAFPLLGDFYDRRMGITFSCIMPTPSSVNPVISEPLSSRS